jgi:hypothetical protein
MGVFDQSWNWANQQRSEVPLIAAAGATAPDIAVLPRDNTLQQLGMMAASPVINEGVKGGMDAIKKNFAKGAAEKATIPAVANAATGAGAAAADAAANIAIDAASNAATGAATGALSSVPVAGLAVDLISGTDPATAAGKMALTAAGTAVGGPIGGMLAGILGSALFGSGGGGGGGGSTGQQYLVADGSTNLGSEGVAMTSQQRGGPLSGNPSSITVGYEDGTISVKMKPLKSSLSKSSVAAAIHDGQNPSKNMPSQSSPPRAMLERLAAMASGDEGMLGNAKKVLMQSSADRAKGYAMGSPAVQGGKGASQGAAQGGMSPGQATPAQGGKGARAANEQIQSSQRPQGGKAQSGGTAPVVKAAPEPAPTQPQPNYQTYNAYNESGSLGY